MSPRRILIASSLLLISTTIQAAEPEVVVNKFLDESAKISNADDVSIPIPSVLKQSLRVAAKPKTTSRATKKSTKNSPRNSTPTLADPPVRLAETPRSVLRLGDENDTSKPLEISPIAEATPSGEDEQKVAAEVKRVESSIDRRMQSLQRSLEREEKQLERRLGDLASKREVALEKSDEKTLKRIENLEKTAVTDYEKRVNRLLSAMATTGQPSPVQKPVAKQRSAGVRRPSPATNNRSRAPNWNSKQKPSRAAVNRAPQARPKPQPQKRRFKLWPFK